MHRSRPARRLSLLSTTAERADAAAVDASSSTATSQTFFGRDILDSTPGVVP